jgi:hypothetical protein
MFSHRRDDFGIAEMLSFFMALGETIEDQGMGACSSNSPESPMCVCVCVCECVQVRSIYRCPRPFLTVACEQAGPADPDVVIMGMTSVPDKTRDGRKGREVQGEHI